MSQEEKKVDNRTATQKIADLENAVMSLYHVNDNLTRDTMTLKDAIKLLDNKVNSIVKAVNAGESLTDQVLTRIMTENNIEELTGKINNMVAQGFLEKEPQVSENAFVVGSEENEKGETINPRLQFAIKALKPELQAKIIGRSPGEVVHLEEGKLNFKVVESYLIKEPKAPVAAPQLVAVPAVEPDQGVTA
jgi:predicted RNase H-like nuclease (RuvC/YqgF family)